MLPVSIVVEGFGDVQIARRLLTVVGLVPGDEYVRNGKAALDARVGAYNRAAALGPWFVLRDMNGDATCPGELVKALVPIPSPLMRLRLAVHAAEAWLIADGEAIADYLRVSPSRVPLQPDALAHPKIELVNLARRSRSRRVKEDMVPAVGHTVQVGPLYVPRLTDFAQHHWRPDVAAQASPSLRRALSSLRNLAAELEEREERRRR